MTDDKRTTPVPQAPNFSPSLIATLERLGQAVREAKPETTTPPLKVTDQEKGDAK